MSFSPRQFHFHSYLLIDNDINNFQARIQQAKILDHRSIWWHPIESLYGQFGNKCVSYRVATSSYEFYEFYESYLNSRSQWSRTLHESQPMSWRGLGRSTSRIPPVAAVAHSGLQCFTRRTHQSWLSIAPQVSTQQWSLQCCRILSQHFTVQNKTSEYILEIVELVKLLNCSPVWHEMFVFMESWAMKQ